MKILSHCAVHELSQSPFWAAVVTNMFAVWRSCLKIVLVYVC